MSDTLLIMAGGTGGHIMPGLAIAKTMQSRGWMVRWLGTRHGMENRLVPEAGITLDTVAFAGMRGNGLMHSFMGALQIARAWWQSMKLMRTLRPTVVLGMGGYVTVPGGLAALMTGHRLVLVNADARLLLSNQVLAPFARRVLFGLPPARALKSHEVYTGAPIRQAIMAVPAPALRFAGRIGPLRVLVVGGSLGAAILNRVVPEALALLPEATRPLVTHQAGATQLAALEQRYAELKVSARALSFIDDMASLYCDVDLVICRSGAITVNELMSAGVASILVPLTVSTTSHQLDNARYMAEQGAARLMQQQAFDARSLADLIASLDRTTLLGMAQKARALARGDASDRVADILKETAGSGRQP